MTEAQIKSYMTKYECSREDAIEAIKYDEETDSMTVGQINKELTPEQRKAVKDNTKTTSGKKTPSDKPRERKPDEDKRHLITMLEVPVHLFGAQIANPEREITFTYNGAEYSVTLTKHRAPKK